MMQIVRYSVLLAALAACARNRQVASDRGAPGSPTVTVDAGTLVRRRRPGQRRARLPRRAVRGAAGRRRALARAAARSRAGAACARPIDSGKNCMQAQIYSDIDPFVAGVSEDCLYLNVWTTALTRRAKRPVMVWIYGGGFNAGFGDEARHDGARARAEGRRRRDAQLPARRRSASSRTRRSPPSRRTARPATTACSTRSRRCSGCSATSRASAATRRASRSSASRPAGRASRRSSPRRSRRGSSTARSCRAATAIGGIRPRETGPRRGVRFATPLGVTGTGADAAARLRAISADSLLRAGRPADPSGGYSTGSRRGS